MAALPADKREARALRGEPDKRTFLIGELGVDRFDLPELPPNRRSWLAVDKYADPAAPPVGSPPSARVLSRPAPQPALASGHDLDLGGRARLVLPGGRDRLLHREIVGWQLELRCRAKESIALVERAVAARGVAPGTLTLGSDNGSAFTARACKLARSSRRIAHRRGGYRDPESQAFIESWFSKLKERCVWLHEFETLDEARETLANYVNRYHHRPHSGLDYRTPAEVVQTWHDALGNPQTHAA